MTQMWPLWCPKTASSSAVTATSVAMKIRDESVVTAAVAASSSSRCHCCCLVTKLMRKLKRRRRSRTLRPSSSAASRQGSFQCRYDPLSYSLNFDSSGCSGSLLDEDYYKFYAFSSRFVMPNPRASSCPIVPVAAGSPH